MKHIRYTSEAENLAEWIAPQLASPVIVVHDGPHRLVGTSPLPNVPFSVDSPSYSPPSIQSLWPSLED
jgi:hypothetical protein